MLHTLINFKQWTNLTNKTRNKLIWIALRLDLLTISHPKILLTNIKLRLSTHNFKTQCQQKLSNQLDKRQKSSMCYRPVMKDDCHKIPAKGRKSGKLSDGAHAHLCWPSFLRRLSPLLINYGYILWLWVTPRDKQGQLFLFPVWTAPF